MVEPKVPKIKAPSMVTATILNHCHFSSKFHLLSNGIYGSRVRHRTRLAQVPFAIRNPQAQPVTFEFNKDQQPELARTVMTKLRVLKHKMDVIGIKCDDSCTPGRYNNLFCPKCRGGQSLERSLSLHIIQDGNFAMWRCFHHKCGWAGKAFSESTCNRLSEVTKVKSSEQMKKDSLGLKPPSEKIISYFNKRKISEGTLSRNSIMQLSANQSVIAFTYKQDGMLVGCKYQTIQKIFWQEKGTNKIFYGLDDIKEATEIIIVEGEIDKLSMEEAGFRNCVSVPCGAPQKVSTKELPSFEKDIAFQYLWNCRKYLDKASRILLATDGDTPGQALAEELARRLGKYRCWRVHWPRKDEFGSFKDANEVLRSLGPAALKKAIENAELYDACVSNQVI